MIFLKLQNLDGSEYVINATCIETIEKRTGDGSISIGLISGRFFEVSDSIDEVVGEIKRLFEEASKQIGG
jgi:uncharacterized protein YlzI (FlbEa/FlbD family)